MRLLVVTEPVHTYLTVTVAGAVAMYDAAFRYQRGYQLPINAAGARAGGESGLQTAAGPVVARGHGSDILVHFLNGARSACPRLWLPRLGVYFPLV